MTDQASLATNSVGAGASASAPSSPQGVGERGIPGFGRPRGKNNAMRLIIVAGLVVGLVFAALGVGIFVKRWTDDRKEAREAERNAPKPSSTMGHNFDRDKEKLARDRAKAAQLEAASAAAAAEANRLATPAGAESQPTAQASQPGPAGRGAVSSGKAPVTAAERKLEGDVLVDLKGNGAEGQRGSRGDAGAARLAESARASDGLDGSLAPSRLASVKAGKPLNLDMLLIRGTTIPCAQEPMIVTTYPGMIGCTVTKDVYSANGKVLLVERGTQVTGEQRKALLQGQARIFVVWTRLVTPNGVPADLDSPGADALGASGLEAYVDTHFWDRFGGAVMLSLINDAGQSISSLSSGGGSGNNRIQFNSTTTAGENLASETLKNTINIPPTAYSNQGSALTIYVARDVDFGDVYELAHP
ncbi:conjugal transfer protein TrbI [Trinickia dabaoshanensis]|uniref:Conjugal transfer protein TrbI n=2 Tax=Trinickia dabaoshanensis TaxID=564714 RepID=A0A2N7VEP8_9BURK|nr:conjugal transfer protein TrbI [Trinickia dabaoshanensis]